jgi:type IV pilus assembly protein PilE
MIGLSMDQGPGSDTGASVDRSCRGFTLIELVVTMAIIAILAILAVSSYTAYVKRGHRSAAESALMDIAQRQQQYLMDNRAYASDLTTLNYTSPSEVTSYYTLSVTVSAGPPPSFTATATPVSGSMQASDGTLTLDSSGNKSPSSKW